MEIFVVDALGKLKSATPFMDLPELTFENTRSHKALVNVTKGAQTALLKSSLEFVDATCGLEVAFTIAQFLRGAALVCDANHTTNQGHAGGLIRVALLAKNPEGMKVAYTKMAEAVKSDAVAFKGKALPEAVETWHIIAQECPQFHFRTANLVTCDCTTAIPGGSGFVEGERLRTYIGLEEIEKRRASPGGGGELHTAGDVCRAFFTKYLLTDVCGICDAARFEQQVVLGRLPWHLCVELPAMDDTPDPTEVAEDVTFSYMTGRGELLDTSFGRTVGIAVQGNGNHFSALILPQGVQGDGWIKDSWNLQEEKDGFKVIRKGGLTEWKSSKVAYVVVEREITEN